LRTLTVNIDSLHTAWHYCGYHITTSHCRNSAIVWRQGI